VNTSSDMAHVLTTESPLATASTPNDTPNTPAAAPRVREAATAHAGTSAPSQRTPSGGRVTNAEAGWP
jgi:hypothetical protein